MKHNKYYFADGSIEFASSVIHAFILHNAKRIQNGYGIATTCEDEDGVQHNIQVIDRH
jgi:hypothetical protein